MKILSWNVNGLRACIKKGFMQWLAECDADVIGLQEVRALPGDLPVAEMQDLGWWTYFHPAEKKGYSGVALLCRTEPDAYQQGVSESRFDCEGRYQRARFGSLWVANGYFPNGSGPNRDHSRIPYKFDFYDAVFDQLETQRADGDAICVIGDFNTAHQEIDLARPSSNHKTSGFTPAEREHFSSTLKRGWHDSFREQHPDQVGAYSWWSQRGRCRERNVGWRIDYALLSPAAIGQLKSAFILPEVMGSDHCPIGVSLDA